LRQKTNLLPDSIAIEGAGSIKEHNDHEIALLLLGNGKRTRLRFYDQTEAFHQRSDPSEELNMNDDLLLGSYLAGGIYDSYGTEISSLPSSVSWGFPIINEMDLSLPRFLGNPRVSLWIHLFNVVNDECCRFSGGKNWLRFPFTVTSRALLDHPSKVPNEETSVDGPLIVLK
jgi:hypothetical protein